MAFETKDIDQIELSDLTDLVTNNVAETITLEFKQDMYGPKEAQNKEAIKDISAMANTHGGHLIIGVADVDGCASELIGVPSSEVDKAIQRLESLVRDGSDPAITGLRIKQIEIDEGHTTLVINIPKSWNGPHRVTTAGINRFHMRNASGVYQPDTGELRMIFAAQSDAVSRIRGFRNDRLQNIREGFSPVGSFGSSCAVLHIVPLTNAPSSAPIDLSEVAERPERFLPIRSGPSVDMHYNLEGYAIKWIASEYKYYTQVFRVGSVETLWNNILKELSASDTIIPARSLVQRLAKAASSYLVNLKALGVQPPFVCMLSFADIGSYKLGFHNEGIDSREIRPFQSREWLLLPEVIIEDVSSEEQCVRDMRPLFDYLWNAAGLERCHYYQPNGDPGPEIGGVAY